MHVHSPRARHHSAQITVLLRERERKPMAPHPQDDRPHDRPEIGESIVRWNIDGHSQYAQSSEGSGGEG